MAEHDTTQPATHQSDLRSEQMLSFISPTGSVLDNEGLPAPELQQKLAEVDPDMPSRVLARDSTRQSSSPILPVERIASFSIEPEAVRHMSTRTSTGQPTHPYTIREAELDPEVIERTLSLTYTFEEEGEGKGNGDGDGEEKEEPQEESVEEPEVEDAALEASLEQNRGATTMDHGRQAFVTLSSSRALSLHVVVDHAGEKEPTISRQPTRRSGIPESEPEPDSEPPLIRMSQSTLQASRRQSLRSPPPVIRERAEPIISRQPIRQPTRRANVPEPEPKPELMPVAETELEAPVIRTRQSTLQASRQRFLRSPSPVIRELVEEPSVTRTPTQLPILKPTEPIASPIEDIEFDVPILRMRASTIPPPPTPEPATPERTPTSPQDPPSPEPISQRVAIPWPIERVHNHESTMRKATTRHLTERLPSPEPVVRKVATRQPTDPILYPEPSIWRVSVRRPNEELPAPESVMRKMSTRRSTKQVHSPEPVVEGALTQQSTGHSLSLEPVVREATMRRPAEKTPSPEPLIRRMTTRKLTERLPLLEPVIGPALTRQTTEPLPQPEEIIRRVTTRRHTEPVEEPLAPHSSPSTQAGDSSLPVIVPTSYNTDDAIGVESSKDMVLPVSRAAEVPSGTATSSPEVQQQIKVPASRTNTLRRQSIQPEQITLLESISSYSSHASWIHDDVEDIAQEPLAEEEKEFNAPVERMRRFTTPHEILAEDVLSEPTFDRQQTMPRRQSTLRRLPIVSKQPFIAGQPTVQKRRATFERAMSIPSQQSTIVSEPNAVDPNSPIVLRVSTRQPTISEGLTPSRVSTSVSHRSTENISRQPTRQLTESFKVPTSTSRQMTRQATVLPSRKPSEYEKPNLIRRNAEDGSEDEESVGETEDEESPIERQATRQATVVSRQPTEALTKRFKESSLGRQAIRQPTMVSRKPTWMSTERLEEPEELERQATKQPTLHSKPSQEVITGEIDVDQEPAMPIWGNREPTRASQEPTRLEKQADLSVESGELPGQSPTSPSPTSIVGVQPIPSHRTTTRTSMDLLRRTTVSIQREATMQAELEAAGQESSSVYSNQESEPVPETVSEADQPPARTAIMRPTTGLTGITISSSEPQEYGLMERMQEQDVSSRATVEKTSTATDFDPPIMRMRQETQLEQPEQSKQAEAEPESEPIEQVQSRRASRVPSVSIEVGLSKQQSRQPMWSTEAPADESLTDDTESDLEEETIPGYGHQASVISQKSTAVSRRRSMTPLRQVTLKQMATLPNPIDLTVERVATGFWRQPNERIPSPFQSSVSASGFVPSPDVIEDEPSAPITWQGTRRLTGIPRQVTVKEKSPSRPVPSRRATNVARQPTARDAPSFVIVDRITESHSESEPQQEEELLKDNQSMSPSRKPTALKSRIPTRILTSREIAEGPVVRPVEKEEIQKVISAPSSRRPTSQISHQLTRVLTERVVFEDASPPADEESLKLVSCAAEAPAQSEPFLEFTWTEEPAAQARQPAVASRQLTRILMQPSAELPGEKSAPPPRRATTRVSRRPTRAATAPFEPPVQRDVQPDQEEKHETVIGSDSSHSSVLDEPLAIYDVYHASPEVVPDVVPEEVFRAVSRVPKRNDSVVRVQEKSSAIYPPSPFSASPSRRPITHAPTRQATLARRAD